MKTRVIVLDLNEEGNQLSEVYERIYNESLADIDVSILINNAGYAHAGAFDEVDDSDIHKMITCNTYPVALLTQ